MEKNSSSHYLFTRVSIADIFQTKKRRKRETSEEEESTTISVIENDESISYNDYELSSGDDDDDEYYDFWGGEYDEYSDVAEIVQTKPRIDFKKYGRTETNNNDTEEDESDISDSLPRNVYCDLVNTLNSKCVMSSLLEMWRYNEEYIKSTSSEEILQAVNELVKSPWYGYDTDYTALLGGVSRDEAGAVVSAESALMVWSTTVPDNVELDTSQGSGVELDLADPVTLAWEQQFIEIVNNMSRDNDDMVILPNAGRSYGDISAQAISSDMFLLLGGYLIMFVFTVFMLGKVNMVEIRLMLAVAGMISIGMGISIAIALSSALGFFWTPMHPALPLLCLGIGIDDMFVIMQSLTNVKKTPDLANLSSDQRISHALKHAGRVVMLQDYKI